MDKCTLLHVTEREFIIHCKLINYEKINNVTLFKTFFPKNICNYCFDKYAFAE